MPQTLPYIDVSIPGVPLPALTYALPPGIGRVALTGMRAVVPIGKRIVTGFITEVHDRRPSASVKEVLELPDEAPILTDGLVRLCRWIARYYHAPLGDTLKAALPQGMDIEGERLVSLQTSDELLIARAVGRSKTKRAIVDLLGTGEVIPEPKLRKAVRAASITAQLRDLAADGIIAMETVMKAPTVKPKLRKAVRLLREWQNEERIRELMEAMEKRAPKQVNIIALLWGAFKSGAHSMSVQDALEGARAGNSAIHALAEKEVVAIFDEEVTREAMIKYEEADKSFELTGEQQHALATLEAQIDAGAFVTDLLYGVTGSGKTQVYIEAIRHALKQGKNALVLVPEVALTPQLVFRFRRAFGNDVTVMHSRLSMGERYDAWRLARDGKYRVAVGVRSAVFAPMQNLGIIIVDEEHEPSYKQSDMHPRFHARDVAVMRGFIESAVVVLGSATPSAETWHNAAIGKYKRIEINHRIDGASMPDIALVDMLEARKEGTAQGDFSDDLTERLRDRLHRKEGAIVYQNRRGYAVHIECRDCNYVPHCVNCSITMTYHKDKDLLRCHYCGYGARLPSLCPECGGKDLKQQGAGTQRLEEDLHALIPEARILRMDFDSTRQKGSHDMMLTAFAEGEADVLLGTQMVAKGLDLEHVTLVGVISAEQSLLMPDFRAEERTFQLMTQVSGRSGRGARKGEVVLQASQPGHPVFGHILAHDYRGFMEKELARRKSLFYPPYSRVALITFADEDESRAALAATEFFTTLDTQGRFFTMYAPQPAILKRLAQRYRYQLFLRIDKGLDADGSKFERALAVTEAAFSKRSDLRSVHITVDIDPYNMM